MLRMADCTHPECVATGCTQECSAEHMFASVAHAVGGEGRDLTGWVCCDAEMRVAPGLIGGSGFGILLLARLLLLFLFCLRLLLAATAAAAAAAVTAAAAARRVRAARGACSSRGRGEEWLCGVRACGCHSVGRRCCSSGRHRMYRCSGESGADQKRGERRVDGSSASAELILHPISHQQRDEHSQAHAAVLPFLSRPPHCSLCELDHRMQSVAARAFLAQCCNCADDAARRSHTQKFAPAFRNGPAEATASTMRREHNMRTAPVDCGACMHSDVVALQESAVMVANLSDLVSHFVPAEKRAHHTQSSVRITVCRSTCALRDRGREEERCVPRPSSAQLFTASAH